MKSFKVFHWNYGRLKDIYPYATKWQVFKYKTGKVVRGTLKIIILSVIAFGLIQTGANFFPNTVYAVQEKEVIVEAEAPVLARIAKCESHNSHFCTDALIKAGLCSKSEKGQVLVKANNNKTIDVGTYQINVYYWGSKATELGFNLFTEEGNEGMAKWLYKNKGTEPWVHSKGCWNK